MMAYVFPINHRNTHTIYNQKTLYLIGQCDVAMVADSHFEYANKEGKFSEILFKLYFWDARRFRSTQINMVNKLLLD